MRLNMLRVHFTLVDAVRQSQGAGNVIAWAPFMHLGSTE
jgi:hypothetical protein